MASDEMTPKAQVAFEVYRDLGPSRSLAQVSKLMGTALSNLNAWSAKYEWVRLTTEHDHAELREGLGKREIIRERGTQQLVDAIPRAVKTLVDIMEDTRQLPILDRQGNQMRGAATKEGKPGALLFKPLVKASTRANCAEKVLGIAGLVPVKRMIVEDKSAEALDAAAAILRSMSPKQVDQFLAIMDGSDDPTD